VNPLFAMTHLEGFYTHPILDDIYNGCSLIVDLSRYGLANKLLLEKGFRERIPIIRGLLLRAGQRAGIQRFHVRQGKRMARAQETVSPNNLPDGHFDDGVMDTIIAGIVLEETKNILMFRKVSDAVISYQREQWEDTMIDRESWWSVRGHWALSLGLGWLTQDSGNARSWILMWLRCQTSTDRSFSMMPWDKARQKHYPEDSTISSG